MLRPIVDWAQMRNVGVGIGLKSKRPKDDSNALGPRRVSQNCWINYVGAQE